VYELSKVHGVNGILDDGQVVKLNDLQVIPKPQDQITTHDEPKVNKVERQAKIDKVLKSVGIDQSNVRSSGRTRKPKQLFGL
jgi:hypothetical protein